MTPSTRTIIRPFDGSLAGAEGLLEVEKIAFDECPYDAAQVQAMLADGPQRAWLALAGDAVVGFVIAFRTTGLQAEWWEIDLLAVLPEWRGRHLGTRLIRACAGDPTNLPRCARAYVASDNVASARAFSRAGLHPTAEGYTLLILRTEGSAASRDVLATPKPEIKVRLASPMDAATSLTLLETEENGHSTGHAELISVQTLLYRGVWLESLWARGPAARQALVREAMIQAVAQGVDELGVMVPASDQPLMDSLLAAGFRSWGNFRRHTASLPLPGLARRRTGAL